MKQSRGACKQSNVFSENNFKLDKTQKMIKYNQMIALLKTENQKNSTNFLILYYEDINKFHKLACLCLDA